jgi:hypothetical protein
MSVRGLFVPLRCASSNLPCGSVLGNPSKIQFCTPREWQVPSVGLIPTYLRTESIQLTRDHARHYIVRNEPCVYSASALRVHTDWWRKAHLHSQQSPPLPVPLPSCGVVPAHQHRKVLSNRCTEHDVPFCDVRPQQIPRTKLRDVVFLHHTRTEGALPRTRLPEEEHAKWASLRGSGGQSRRQRRRLWRRPRKSRLGGLGRARDSTAVCFRDRGV